MERRYWSREVPQEIDTIPIRSLAREPAYNRRRDSELDLLHKANLHVYRLGKQRGMSKFFFLLDTPLQTRSILRFANYLAPAERNDDGYEYAAWADIDEVELERVTKDHNGLIKLGYLDGPQVEEFRRMKTGLNAIGMGDHNAIFELNDNHLGFDRLVRRRMLDRDGAPIRAYLNPNLLLLGKAWEPEKFSLIAFKSMVYELDFQRSYRHFLQHNQPNLLDIPLWPLYENRLVMQSRRSTAEVIPTLIFNPQKNGSPFELANNNLYIEKEARRIMGEAILPQGFQIAQSDLDFPYLVSHAMSALTILALFDNKFRAELKLHWYVKSNGEDGKKPEGGKRLGQLMQALQTILLSDLLFNKNIGDKGYDLRDFPVFANLYERISKYG